MLKKFLTAAALTVFGAAAQAATVNVSLDHSQRLVLENLSSITLDFSLPQVSGFVNGGGYVLWSNRADGRKDDAGNWGDCFECGFSGGSWNLASNGVTSSSVTLNFGGLKETVYLWFNAWGGSSVAYQVASASIPAPVPVPAAGLLLLAGVGGLGLFARRRSPRVA